jgi:hypothetical protein
LNDVELTKLVCALLGEIPGWDWHDSDEDLPDAEPYVYARDVVGVFYGPISDTPDKAAGVTVYGSTDERHLSWRRVQIRLRGDRGRPNGADALSAPSFELLQGLTIPGIADISRLSMAPAGVDQNRRNERTENYIIILDNQETLA